MIGLGLYIGDGYKNDKNVGFANTNPNVILFMMDWLRVFTDVDEDDFRGQIWIHEGLGELRARKYWSRITKIPITQFRKSYMARNKFNTKKLEKIYINMEFLL